MGVKIFMADIIYHLFDQFTKYVEQFTTDKKEAAKDVAIFPCKLKIYEGLFPLVPPATLTTPPEHIFNTRSPIVVGVKVTEGILRKGTPIVIPSREMIAIGRVAGIQRDHQPVEEAQTGEDVAIEIAQPEDKQQYMYGRHFTHEDELVSLISRQSIDAMKENFKDILTQPAIFKLVKELKKVFNII